MAGLIFLTSFGAGSMLAMGGFTAALRAACKSLGGRHRNTLTVLDLFLDLLNSLWVNTHDLPARWTSCTSYLHCSISTGIAIGSWHHLWDNLYNNSVLELKFELAQRAETVHSPKRGTVACAAHYRLYNARPFHCLYKWIRAMLHHLVLEWSNVSSLFCASDRSSSAWVIDFDFN